MARRSKVVVAAEPEQQQRIVNRVVAIDVLAPHPRNYRQHPEAQIGRLTASVARFGQVRSIVVQEGPSGYLIVAGHGLVEAARRRGLVDLRADIIPADWTPEQVEGYLIADNETGRLAEDDLAQLIDLVREQDAAGFDLASIGMSRDDLDALIASLDEDGAPDRREVDDLDGGGDDFDTTPDESGPTRCQPGDLWQLGEHRLLCGDATDERDVRALLEDERVALLATDPPYNVGKNYGEDVNDAKLDAEYEAFSRGWFAAWCAVSDRQIVTPGCNNLASWLRWFEAYHWAPWTKTNAMTNGKVSRFWCWEPILFFGEKWPRSRPNDVFDFPAGMHKGTGGHPCPKPLRMWVDLFEHYADTGDIVADAFAGSGTAIIAAERTDRRCYALELEAKWCDVILRRWEAETGREAVLLHRVSVADEGVSDGAA